MDEGLERHDEFIEALTNFFELLPAKALCLPGMYDRVYPYPQIVYNKEFELLSRIGQTVSEAIQLIVENYVTCEQLQKYIPVSEEVFSLFARISHLPVRNCFLRPDFIQSTSSEPLICEIGARFPLNGYLASAYLDEAITDERSIFELHKDRILDALGVNQGIEESPQSFEVLILTGKEVGFDIHYLASEITGVEMMSYTSEAWREPNQADLIILELRKEEVESVLDVIVDLMLKGQRFVNDPRTVIVGHDKMLLKFLKDRAYLSTIIGKEKATFLTNHIIETYSVVHDKIDLRNKSHWVAKLKHGGKRIGMLVGAVESDERWSKVNEEFVIQPYIEQTDVQIYNHISRRLDTANRVGMMLTIDGKFIGLGMYRFFSKDLRFLTMGGHIVVEDYQ